MPASSLDTIVSLCKRRGFVFPGSDIYGGLANTWDYGPLGVELKENIKKQWWRTVVQSRDDIVGLDSSVILPRQTWVASGHVGVFTDPLTVSRDDLANTTWLTTNFWMGSTGSTVKVQIDGGETVEAVRTQQMQGEGQLVGAEWSDPVAVQEQLVNGGSLADRMMHLWRLQLPADLAAGEHTATVTATVVYGRTFTETLTFQVAG